MAPIHHPLAGQKRIPLARIVQEPFWVREPGSGSRMAMERLFDKHNLKLNIRMEISSGEAIRQGIIGGLDISVLSQHGLALGDWQHHLDILDVEEFPSRGFWYICAPSTSQWWPKLLPFSAFSSFSNAKDQHRANLNPNPDWLSGKGDKLQPPALAATPGGLENHG